ncbi:MAG: single-stranded DNA-binding protein [Oscillospiraceae bacterium]|nr:single-stranded DNA-binding protein [Candidatus Limimonas coprohippi]MCQ2487804.1 single-stranded DNA-binding protein [Clostridia bacterium]
MKAIFLSGRLTRDPEIKEINDKKTKVANFTVANNQSDGENGEFFDVVCWDKTAEYAEKYLKKGQKVVVQGTFQNESYKDKDDNTRYHFRITAHTIDFLS